MNQQSSESKVSYDRKDQYDRIAQYIIPGETLTAVFDCKGGGTGFVGITDQRLIFYDQGILMKKKSMVSIPYHQVIGVASADEGNVFKVSEISLLTAARNSRSSSEDPTRPIGHTDTFSTRS